MFSVFSNTKEKPSNQIVVLQQCAGSKFSRILFAGPKDEPLYILKPEVLSHAVNKEGLNILEWVNKNILYQLPRVKTCSDAQWIGVRIRIASNMFNKIEQEGILSKDICIEYHQRLTSNVRKILGEIYTEDLPF